MSIVPVLRVPSHQVWITVVLFVCLLLFSWIRITNPKKIPSLVSGFFRGGTTGERNITPDAIALFFIFICSVVLVALRAFRYHNISTRFTQGEDFLLLGLIILCFYLLKTLVLLLCGTIFQVENDAREYINEIYASTHLAAVGLLPAAVVVTFVNNINENGFEIAILVLIGLFFLYRTTKMFILMMNRGLSVMYLFLYLCTLEIIPLVLLYECRKGFNF